MENCFRALIVESLLIAKDENCFLVVTHAFMYSKYLAVIH